jgi:hypothetical protein
VCKKPTIATTFEINHQAEDRLLAIPGVHGVGFGWKEVEGKITNVPAWRVYVSEKLPGLMLRHANTIPREIAGIPTDVLILKTGLPVSGESYSHGAVLTAGATLSNLKGVLSKSIIDNRGSGLGALGFFAALRGAPNWQNLVLVSNRHVLLAHGAQQGDLVFQPEYTLKNGQYHFRNDKLNPIAEILDEGLEGNYMYRYPDEPAREYFIDCATARLTAKHTTRIPADPPPIGRRTKILFRGIARVHEFDVFAGRELQVYKLGRPEVIGRVVDVRATVKTSDQRIRHNNLVIRAESQKGKNEQSFADTGDSGALIVDELNRAVGLLWGKSLHNRTEAFACHIHPILHRLKVTPLPYNLQVDP